ncbi:MAG: SDR family oxidoreductase [Burkholderiales bacterium]
MSQPRILILGADSLIGSSLCHHLGSSAIGTSRHASQAGHIHLDLSAAGAAKQLDGVFDAAILCAAMTRHDQCTADPVAALRSNVQAPAEIAGALMARGTHVVFLSTDSVFGANNPVRSEDDPVQPGEHTYPAMKAQAEKSLALIAAGSGMASQLAVVRMTKVVSARREPFGSWCSALKSGQTIEPLCDLLMAPISLRYVVAALARIATQRIAGVLHLSGASDLSYAAFAQGLARKMNRLENVNPRSARQAGVQPSYWPRYSRLTMPRTQGLAGLKPQGAEQVACDLLDEFRSLTAVNAPCDIAA